VFSPYYRSAFARGKGDPENHVAINVALYGAKRRWTMTERGRLNMQRDAHSFTVGPSSLHWNGKALEIRIHEMGVPLPWPVRGTVRVYPEALNRVGFALDSSGLHRWGPIAACARVEAEFAQPALRWKGHGYLDSNEGDEPIERRFQEWDWSRATLTDGSTAVIYDVQPTEGEQHVIAQRFFPDGRVEPFAAPARQSLPKTAWRIARRQRSDEGVPVSVIEQLEDTPFYQRAVLASGLFGQRVISVHETLNVPRLVSPVVQKMLPFRMPRLR
jgi:carotenoid 1,2-hydratase